MKLKNILFYLFTVTFMCMEISAQNTNPEVTNVEHSYNSADGTITITYYLMDAEQDSVYITMVVSSDGGFTWDYPCCFPAPGDHQWVSTSSTATQKTIIWFHDLQHGGPPSGSSFIIRIYADDKTHDGSPCPGIPTVTYGGKTYNTILIGEECWLKENLDVGTMILGIEDQTNNGIIEKYCWGNNPSYCFSEGGLYQWNEVMQYSTTFGTQGICPPGWHIPIHELIDLGHFTSGTDVLAWGEGEDGRGTNISGFSALLTGTRFPDGNFTPDDFLASYFSSINNSSAVSILQIDRLGNFYLQSSSSTAPGGPGFSVRCIKD